MGQIHVSSVAAGYLLRHRDDCDRQNLQRHRSAGDAMTIARFDDAREYRPLKTAPNLAHGWRLELSTVSAVREALDYFYPGRLAAFAWFMAGELTTTPLRETLGRQTGMYRVAANVSDAAVNKVVGDFCRSDGGCLRTILWHLDGSGEKASTALPPQKYDPTQDQVQPMGGGESPEGPLLPLLCQEACGLLVGECRKAVRSTRKISPERA